MPHFRNAAQMNVPGASAIADELGKLFKRVHIAKKENKANENAPATEGTI